jgi:hypothetical protein
MSRTTKIVLLDDFDRKRLAIFNKLANDNKLQCYPSSYEQIENKERRLIHWKEKLNCLFDEATSHSPNYVFVNLHLGEVSASSCRLSEKEADEICEYLETQARAKNIIDQSFIDLISANYDLRQYRIAFWVTLISSKYQYKVALIIYKNDFEIERLLSGFILNPVYRFKQHINNLKVENLLEFIYPILSIEEFLKETHDFNFHRRSQHFDPGKTYLQRLIGINSNNLSWIGSQWTDVQIEECLKSMCGDKSILGSAQDGKSSLNLLGAFHILLSKIYKKTRSRADEIPEHLLMNGKQIAFKFNPEDNLNYLLNDILPVQSKRLAKITFLLLCEIFEEIVLFDSHFSNDLRSGKVLIEKICLNQKGMDIFLCLDCVMDRKNLPNKQPLGQSLNDTVLYRFIDIVNNNRRKTLITDSLLSKPHNAGNLSNLIYEFNLVTSIDDNKSNDIGSESDPKLVFPQQSRIEVYSVNKNTLLRLCATLS